MMKARPTQRAADGWVRTGKLAFSRLTIGSVSLTGSPHPPLTPTVGRVALELIYFYIRLLYNDFVPFITNS